MEGQERQIPDGNSDAARKKPAASERHERDQVASTSRMPEPAHPENAKTQREKLSQNLRVLWKLDPIDLDERAACRDQQRRWGLRYAERRYSAEMEPYNQYHGYYRQHPDWDTRRHRELAYRYFDHDDRSGRSRQRSRKRDDYDGGYNSSYYGRPQYSRPQSDNRERQRRSPDQWETERKPYARGRKMQGSQEVSTSNRPISRSPGQGSNPPTRRDSNQTASNQPVPQLLSPGRSSSMGPQPSVVSTPAENQPVGQPSQNVPQGPLPSVVSTPAENQPVGQPSPNETQIDPKFRKVILESPWLYDPSRVECKDKVLEEQSWTDVSSACGMTVAQCIDKLKQIQNKYRRLRRRYAEKGSLSARDMQFINDWQFLPYKKRTTTQNTRPTVSHTANQTQSPSLVPSSSIDDTSLFLSNCAVISAIMKYNRLKRGSFQRTISQMRDSNQTASNQPVPQPSSPGQSSSMDPPPSVVPTAEGSQPKQPSENVPQIKMEIDKSFLISLVRDFPYLWNPRDPAYTDAGKKVKTWAYINEIFSRDNPGIDGNACRKEWEQIRGKYAKKIRRQPEFIDEDFMRLMDTELVFLKPIYEATSPAEVIPSPLVVETKTDQQHSTDSVTATMSSIVESAIAELQSPSSKPSGVQTSKLNQSRGPLLKRTVSTPSKLAHTSGSSSTSSITAPSSSPAKIFKPSAASTAIDETIAHGRSGLDNSNDYTNSSAAEANLNLEGRVMGGNERDDIQAPQLDVNQLLVDGVRGNITLLSPQIKKLMWNELLRVNAKFLIDKL